MLNTILSNGGATINNNGKLVTLKSGYQISKQDVLICDAEALTEQMLLDILAMGLKRGEYCGVWIDEGKAYVDISVRVATKREALAMGKQLHQLTVLQWATMKCLPV